MCHLGIVLVHYIRQNDAERCSRKACQQKSKRKPATWSEFQKPYKTFFLLFGVKLQKNKEGELTAVLLNVQLRILLETYLQNLF